MGKKLSLREIESCLLVLFRLQEKRDAWLTLLVREVLNDDEETNPKLLAARNQLTLFSIKLTAKRLRKNDPNVPLLSAKDTSRFIPKIFKAVVRAEGIKLQKKEKETIVELLQEILGKIFESVNNPLLLGPSTNVYEEYWRQIMIVSELLEQNNLSPEELLEQEWAIDEMTRLSYSKEGFLSKYEAVIEKYSNPKTIFELVVRPFLKLECVDDPKMLTEMEKELKEEIMSQLAAQIENVKIKVIYPWINKEADRIFLGTA